MKVGNETIGAIGAIGTIGVSGSSIDGDENCAKAGVCKITDQLK